MCLLVHQEDQCIVTPDAQMLYWSLVNVSRGPILPLIMLKNNPTPKLEKKIKDLNFE